MVALVTPHSRAQDVAWAESMGGILDDSGNAVAVDRAGNTYVTGAFKETATFGSFSLTSAGDRDIFVAKFDRNGIVLWAERMGGESLDRGYGIAVDEGGNAFVTGRFRGTAGFGSHDLTSGGEPVLKIPPPGYWKSG